MVKKAYSLMGSITISMIAAALILYSGGTPAQATNDPGFTVASLNLLNSKRVSRTDYEYTYTVDLTNTGANTTNTTATVNSTSSHTTVIDGDLTFGDVATNTTATSSDTFTIRQNRRYPFDPASIEINIMWPVADSSITGLKFSYPTFGNLAQLTTKPLSSGYEMLDVSFGAQGLPVTSQYRLVFGDNPNQLSLFEWFNADVDVDGTIVASGAYTVRTLSNGVEVLSLNGPVPENYGPIAGIYAMTPLGDKVITITASYTNQFDVLGLEYDEIGLYFIAMLETLTVP